MKKRQNYTKTWLTVGILHGLSLLGGFGDDFDHPAVERTHFLSVAQEESQQQAEMLPLVLIRDEQGLGAGEHLMQTGRESVSDGQRDVSGKLQLDWNFVQTLSGDESCLKHLIHVQMNWSVRRRKLFGNIVQTIFTNLHLLCNSFKYTLINWKTNIF